MVFSELMEIALVERRVFWPLGRVYAGIHWLMDALQRPFCQWGERTGLVIGRHEAQRKVGPGNLEGRCPSYGGKLSHARQRRGPRASGAHDSERMRVAIYGATVPLLGEFLPKIKEASVGRPTVGH